MSGIGPVPPKNQPPPPNRTVRYYTIGTGTTLDSRAISSMATSPNEGDVQATPLRLVNVGKDSQSRSISVPSISQGSQYVGTVTIPFPRLPAVTQNQGSPTGPGPTPKLPLTTRQQDQLVFAASMTVGNQIAGLRVVRFTAVPQARSGGQVFNGPTLPVGQQYSSFQVLCTVTLANDTTSPATQAGSITVTAEGELTRQAAGGGA